MTAGPVADLDESLGILVLLPAPTEPEVTNVTAASTAGVALGDDQRVVRWVLLNHRVAGSSKMTSNDRVAGLVTIPILPQRLDQRSQLLHEWWAG